ncbi:hypothetical protein [Leptospira terpstrae]|uniref:Lipoprotein n=1 Tax=Leptospira terpstrae serovar Hualin str. LT 11-33 = ATCC 700639 TaxID=1257025 RepID=N1VK70_9LEPT|nr:hypothetical protein [Leptospira terpstrae]EMY60139.1 hypothetical protein LEP1GSC203_0752 [Leptospira terpstrae serovar Hualin str. LT 11-33 = ATCC 700639]
MNFKKSVYAVLALVLVFAVNCSSSAKRLGDYKAPNYSTTKLNEKVVLTYTPEANAEVKDSEVFKEENFLRVYKTKLKEKGVFSDKAKETIEIKINDVRFRSEGVAIWIGSIAGADSMDLVLTIKDAKGNIIDQHNITVAYGLGGFVGGPNETRAEHFYEKITQLTLQQLGYPVE